MAAPFLTRSSGALEPAFLAQRRRPESTHVEIPSGHQGLVTRGPGAASIVKPGRVRVRRWLQPQPELYIYPTEPQTMPIWIPELTSADGQPITLGWHIRAQIGDIFDLWQNWLADFPLDDIPLPGEPVCARLANAVQQFVGRHSLDDLRNSAETRREVATRLSLAIGDQLKPFGLELATGFDPQRLRILTDRDLTAAQQERAALQRLRDDEKLKTALNRIENAEVLRHRLDEWEGHLGITLGDDVKAEVMAEFTSTGSLERALSLLARARATPPPDYATPQDPELLLPTPDERRWLMLRRLSQFVAIGTVIVTSILAAIAIFEPGVLSRPESRNHTLSAVMGIALLGLMVAWVIDQFMRRNAENAVQRLLAEANLNPAVVKSSRLEGRHLLMLVGATVAIASTAATFWLPAYDHWFRFVGAVVGILGAGLASRADWLHNGEFAQQVVSQARRQVVGARLDAVARTKLVTSLQTDLSVDAEVTLGHLKQAADAVYRTHRDRGLTAAIQSLEKRVGRALEAVDRVTLSRTNQNDSEWQAVEERAQQLRERAARCAARAKEFSTLAQQGTSYKPTAEVDALRVSISELEELLTRWEAVAH